MKKKYIIYSILAVLVISCKETPNTATDAPQTNENSAPVASSEETVKADITACQEKESVVWESENFVSYTEDRMRGKGVISFTMDINDRLDILNEDNSNFGEIVLNEDLTFFTLTMPKKVVARKVITTYDFAAFDFDCENVDANRDYFLIYVNKQKRKVKKTGLKYTFSTWEEYIKKQSISLKDCNMIADQQGNSNPKSKDQVFTITEINGDEIKITSSKDCQEEDKPFQVVNGMVKWKSGNVLLIDFAVCN